MIVFFGTMAQAELYIRQSRHYFKDLKFGKDLVLSSSGSKVLQGHWGPVDAVFCPAYHPSEDELHLVKLISVINKLNQIKVTDHKTKGHAT